MHRWLVDEFGMEDFGKQPGRVKPRRLGMVTEGPVHEGGVLVRVPLEAMMSRRTALQCPDVVEVMERAAGFGYVGDWDALALHLLLERAAGDKSRWAPYVRSLPEEAQLARGLEHPLLWPQPLIEGLFQGSPLLPSLLQRQDQCKATCQALLQGGADPQVVSLGSVQWASVVLLSRAFYLDLDADDGDPLADPWGTGGGETVLVPWADLLNHSPDAGEASVLRFDPEEGCASLRAHRSYEAGEEVFDSYGPLRSPTQIFLDHGFVDRRNLQHRVELPASWLSIEAGPAALGLLKAAGLEPNRTMFSLGEDGPEETGLMAWVRAVVATPEELRDDLGWDLDWDLEWSGDPSDSGPSAAPGPGPRAGGGGPPGPRAGGGGVIGGGDEALESAFRALALLSEPLNPRNERAALDKLLKVCEDRLAAYPTTLEVDDLILSGRLPRTGLPAEGSRSMEAIIEASLGEAAGAPPGEAAGPGGEEGADSFLDEVPESLFQEIGAELVELQGFAPGAVQRAERLAVAARASEKRALIGARAAVAKAINASRDALGRLK